LNCHLQIDADPDPDPAYHIDADPNHTFQFDADPCGSESATLGYGTVFVRISDMARISASFGLFYVLWCYFEMRHYFNDVKVPKNAQDQCEFEYLFII
jgi:hypothetical protein